jgi:hypothetical protein
MSSEESKKSEKECDHVGRWGMIASRMNKFMDEQRLERLKQCQEIEQVLKHCQERRKNIISNSKEVEEEWDVDQTVPGTRMMRYFGWHEETPSSPPSFSTMLHSSNNNNNNNNNNNDHLIETSSIQPKETTTTTSPLIIPSCAKESHALWGCRAVGLGCAGHLRHLRECFQTTPQNVLSNPNTAYEPSNNTTTRDSVPCQELQETLGRCVIKEAKELQQRLHPRKTNPTSDK